MNSHCLGSYPINSGLMGAAAAAGAGVELPAGVPFAVDSPLAWSSISSRDDSTFHL